MINNGLLVTELSDSTNARDSNPKKIKKAQAYTDLDKDPEH